MSNKIVIIAEAGVNHNGDISLAKELIDVAAEAGADYVKFQTFNVDRLVTHSVKKANYQKEATDSTQSQHEMLRKFVLTEAMHIELIAHCEMRNIRFLSTAFDIESVDLLLNLGQECFKIPSGDITNLPYLRHVGSLGKTIILSTGMSTLGEIEAAIDILEDVGTLRSKITILHCTTEYPTPVAEVNLRAMQSIYAAFGTAIGYSDHTQGIEISIAAVAMGATVIEKHFTLDRNLPGPDHRASLEPNELVAMVTAIRNVEIALGDGVKRPSPSEIKNRSIIRKILVAEKKIRYGERFTNENVAVKRAGSGISPMRWNEVIGRTASRNFDADEPIDF